MISFCTNSIKDMISVIGNPPYKKITNDKKLLAIYKKNASNKNTNNIFAFFIEKAISIGNIVH